MVWVTFSVPAERNDLFMGLLALSAQRGGIMRVHLGHDGARVVRMDLDAEGERAAQEVMARSKT